MYRNEVRELLVNGHVLGHGSQRGLSLVTLRKTAFARVGPIWVTSEAIRSAHPLVPTRKLVVRRPGRWTFLLKWRGR